MKLTVYFFLTLSAVLIAGILHAQVDTAFRNGQMITRDNIIVTRDIVGENSKKLPGRVTGTVTEETILSGQNDCGVHASFTPKGDSISSTNIPVTFTSTSSNATSVQWYLNGI